MPEGIINVTRVVRLRRIGHVHSVPRLPRLMNQKVSVTIEHVNVAAALNRLSIAFAPRKRQKVRRSLIQHRRRGESAIFGRELREPRAHMLSQHAAQTITSFERRRQEWNAYEFGFWPRTVLHDEQLKPFMVFVVLSFVSDLGHGVQISDIQKFAVAKRALFSLGHGGHRRDY